MDLPIPMLTDAEIEENMKHETLKQRAVFDPDLAEYVWKFATVRNEPPEVRQQMAEVIGIAALAQTPPASSRQSSEDADSLLDASLCHEEDLDSRAFKSRRESHMAFLIINADCEFEIFWHPKGTKVNAEVYLDCLREALRSFRSRGTARSWVLQEDNAPCHVAKAILEAKEGLTVGGEPLKMLVGEFGTKWPALSPDLNVIENLWAWLDNKVRAAEVQTVTELRALVHRELKSEQGRAVIGKLCDSFERRLRKCIELEGQNVQNTNPRSSAALPERSLGY